MFSETYLLSEVSSFRFFLLRKDFKDKANMSPCLAFGICLAVCPNVIGILAMTVRWMRTPCRRVSAVLSTALVSLATVHCSNTRSSSCYSFSLYYILYTMCNDVGETSRCCLIYSVVGAFFTVSFCWKKLRRTCTTVYAIGDCVVLVAFISDMMINERHKHCFHQ